MMNSNHPQLEPPSAEEYQHMTEKEKDKGIERVHKHLRATIKEILDAKQDNSQ